MSKLKFARVKVVLVAYSSIITDGAIDHSGGNERHLLRTDRDLVQLRKAFVRKCSWLCIIFLRVWNRSYDSRAETDVFRRFPTTAKVLGIYIRMMTF